MDILVRQPTIYDPTSPFHLHKADLLIRDGVFHSIESSINSSADQIIEAGELGASPGWVDCFSHFCDPGFEHRETLEWGGAAASQGGFTDVLVVPNTSPIVHNKSGIEYIVAKSKHLPVTIHPLGAITKNVDGKELAEMYDMAASGAVAFTDGIKTIQSAGLLIKALQYLKSIEKTIIQLPDDCSIQPNGLMSEGIISTQLGLPGKPSIAEELTVSRDIELVKYTGSKIHITGLSTAGSVKLIREAKASGVAVTCSVSPAHLYFTDADLQWYDTNLKLLTPLRTEEDRQALLAGIMDGTIDCIASHHIPQHADEKVIEFEYAAPGMIGLQSAFAVVRTVLPDFSLEKLVHLFSTHARTIFDLPQVQIAQGAQASITLFNPNKKWRFTKESNQSLSHNSAFFGKEFTGQPAMIINKNRVIYNDAYEF